MDIYIKAEKKVNKTGAGVVRVKDVAKVFAEGSLRTQAENLRLLEITSDKKKNYLVSVLDIVEKINSALPGNTVSSLGETDTVIEYSPKAEKGSSPTLWIKVFFVSMVLLTGSATAIMSFH